MLRITLTAQDRAAVEARRRDSSLHSAERDRVEMILLSASGWTVPQLASHFHCCLATVRRLLHQFAAEGLPALHRQHRGPTPDIQRHERIQQALAEFAGAGAHLDLRPVGRGTPPAGYSSIRPPGAPLSACHGCALPP